MRVIRKKLNAFVCLSVSGLKEHLSKMVPEVKKTSIRKDSKLLGMGIRFDGPFLETWDISNMVRKRSIDEARDS